MARQATSTSSSKNSPAPAGGRTRAEKVADILREEIVRGKLPPGEALREIHLAKRLRVSRIPLREALRILEGEGLTIHRAHHGAVVRPMSAEEALEIHEVRQLLEPAALKLAGPALVKEDLEGLDGVLAKMRKEKDIATWMQLRADFYLRLLTPMKRPILLGLVLGQQRVSARYLHTFLQKQEIRAEVERHYEKILRAIRRKEFDKVEKLQGAGAEGLVDQVRKGKLGPAADGAAAATARRPAAKRRATAKAAKPAVKAPASRRAPAARRSA